MYSYYKYTYVSFFGELMDNVRFERSDGFSDEELVARIQAGDYECFGILFKRHVGLIRYIVGKYCPESEAEDALSEGFLSFFKAVKLYSPDKGASFKTFFSMTVKSDIFDIYKKRSAKSRIPGDALSPIEEAQVVEADNPESLFIRKESVKSFFDKAKSVLSDFEYTVFCDRCFGKSYSEIAAGTGKSEKAVGAALARARKKMQSEKR